MNNIQTVKHNPVINLHLDCLLAATLEEAAGLYGVYIRIQDTDWQVVFKLKEDLFKALQALGVNVVDD